MTCIRQIATCLDANILVLFSNIIISREPCQEQKRNDAISKLTCCPDHNRGEDEYIQNVEDQGGDYLEIEKKNTIKGLSAKSRSTFPVTIAAKITLTYQSIGLVRGRAGSECATGGDEHSAPDPRASFVGDVPNSDFLHHDDANGL